MDKKIQFRFETLKSKKTYNTFIYILSNNLLVNIFLTLFFISQEQSEISLYMKGSGYQNVLNNIFYTNPSEIIVNEESKCWREKYCNLENEFNNVTIKFDTQISSCARMFYQLTNVLEIDLSKFDISKVSNMEMMFSGCLDLERIIFGNINTSLVQNMYPLFYNCKKLTSIDLSNFDTSSVIEMMETFSQCNSLLSIDVSKFNTQNVENMYVCLLLQSNFH